MERKEQYHTQIGGSIRMLIRVAIAGENISLSNKLANLLIAFSVQKLPTGVDESDVVKYGRRIDVEMDIGFYPTVESLLHAYKNLDIAFLPYATLEKGRDRLRELFKCNGDCIAVPIGEPDSLVCRYLAVRPGGHIGSCDDEGTLRTLFETCVRESAESVQVLRFTTRKGAHAVNTREITYCQSDQKYVQIETASGTSYRKIGKLDVLAESLPSFWRIHQSYLVNPAFTVGLDKSEIGWELRLVDGCRLPVSRAYRKEIEAKFQDCPLNCQK